MKCKECNLVYASPLPIPADIQDHYGVSPDRYWDRAYLDVQNNYFQDQLDVLAKLFGNSVGGDRLKALDIGAGLGKCMLALSNAGFDTYGIEASESFYETAIVNHGVPAAKLSLGRVEEIEFERDFFDFVTFGAVLEHLPDPSLAITKALQWLKPGGLIHAEVPSSSWLVAKLVNLFYKTTGADYVANLSPMHPPYHLYEFGLSSFLHHGQQNGYTVTRHRFHVCQTYMPKILDPLLKRIMKATDTGMQLEVWLRKEASPKC
jgi:2-polyprenyl-3-methyl-5-hydroxy-6-metoxy-1,4-benzoquinol methylase